MSRLLDVYLKDRKAGELIQDDDASLTFTYDRGFLATDPAALSVSLPLQDEPFGDRIARPFFSGLLPDDRARRRLGSALGVSSENAFGLLEIIGGECAGALSLLPPGQSPPAPTSDEIEPLDDKRLEEILALLRQRPLLGGEADVRLSLAGAQDKLAVAVIDGQITLPKAGRPTTHILKPFNEELDGTVENEVFCMSLARRLGLDFPLVSKGVAGKSDYFLVERYDRITHGDGRIERIHQEDFCQALSVPPELKYEEEGGPGISQCQELIRRTTGRPAAEILRFQRMLIFHYLIGNADAHAKNYALLYRGKVPDLAPIYDAVCTAAYPRISQKLAMTMGGRSLPDTILMEHWASLVPSTRASRRMLAGELTAMADAIATEAVALFEEVSESGAFHPILKTVRKVIETRCNLVRRAVDGDRG
ncbi:MAG: type II toxin-antitoxin system HipA family toxin [Hoeflea sp.]|uniref:type II toxin-antitoxin system HipA family toxin n=1 Tax=Hoeflea sp. TaxID=1940281 RepID=UPI002731283B|nr:type II toxin-antitoxin system HipA family toxin [Hoeflea sp.]MDP2119529.1 type II toxin-antitoxin system HipA family toxin [Hoeflea sp.]